MKKITLFVVYLLFLHSVLYATDVGGTISTNTTWTSANNPYVVIGSVAVDSGVTLTIGPDVIVKFNAHTGMTVSGTLDVNGSAGNEVYLTAYTDDTVGGDTNGDGNATSPAANYWNYIYIRDNGNADIKHAVIRYGGYYASPFVSTTLYKVGDNGTLNVSDTNITDTARAIRLGGSHSANTFTHVTPSNITNECIYSSDSSFTLSDSNMSACGGSSGVYALNGSDANITGNFFSNNGNGIYLNTSDGTVTNNTFSDNTYGLYLNNTVLSGSISGNNFLNNDQPIRLTGNSINTTVGSNSYDAARVMIDGTIDINTTLQLGDFVYLVNGVTVNTDKKLTINSDVIVKFNHAKGMTVNGTLDVNGTAGHEVYFTAYTDDSVGGDTNDDNTTTSPAANYWNYIYIRDNGSADIKHAVIRYGGYYAAPFVSTTLYKIGDNGTLNVSDTNITDTARAIRLGGSHSANTFTHVTPSNITNECIHSDNAAFTLLDSNMSACGGNGGVYATNASDANITENFFSNNGYGVYLNTSDGDVTNNTFSDNTYGLYLNNSILSGTVNGNSFTDNDEPVRLTGNSIGTVLGTNNYNPTARAIIDGTVDINTSLQLTDLVYVNNGITINTDKKLTINPDVIVKFNSAKGMAVKGILDVNGTTGNEVYFTAYTDDSVGGDTNDDNTTTSPTANYWNYIYVYDNASANIKHAVIRYGGNYFTPFVSTTLYKVGDNGTLNVSDTNITDTTRTIRLENSHSANTFSRITPTPTTHECLYANNSTFTLSDSNLSGCGANGAVYATGTTEANLTNIQETSSTYGLYLNNNSGLVTVTDSSFNDNTNDGIYVVASPISLTNVTANNNNNGIYFSNVTDANVTDSTFTDNGVHGLSLSDSIATISDSTMASNSSSGVYVTGASSTATLYRNVIKYNDVGITNADSATTRVGGSASDGNDIFSNVSFGINNTDAGTTVQARYNYWGDPTGPAPSGEGDEVSDYVTFSSYLEKPRSAMAVMLVSTDILDFKSAGKGRQSPSFDLQVRNIGSANLDIGHFAPEGAEGSSYSVVSDSCGGQSIVPDTNCSIHMALKPLNYHELPAHFVLDTNDERNIHKNIDLSGVGATGIAFNDGFKTTTLRSQWKITNEDTWEYSFNDEKAGALRIYTSDTGMDGASNNLKNLFTVPVSVYTQQNYYAQSSVSFATLPTQEFQQASLSMLADDGMSVDRDNFLRISVVYDGGDIIVKARYEVDGNLSQEAQSTPLALSTNQKVYLRIEKRDDSYSLTYSLDAHNYTEVMSVGSTFKVSYVGVAAFNTPATSASIAVDFDDLKLQFFPPIPSMPAIRFLLN